MYCNIFFHCLAAHMLSSETFMLASKEPLSNKRVHQENKVDKALIDESIDSNTCANKRTAYMSDERFKSTSNDQKSLLTTEKSITHTSDVSKFFREEDNGCINVLSDSVSETESDANHAKQSSTNKLLSNNLKAIKVLPVNGDIFNRAFTPEEYFMINLCHICDEANAPFDLLLRLLQLFVMHKSMDSTWIVTLFDGENIFLNT